ncbi:MAG: hypothetical protein U1F33_00230 [Alphaproteobacteria bacterium]
MAETKLALGATLFLALMLLVGALLTEAPDSAAANAPTNPTQTSEAQR